MFTNFRKSGHHSPASRVHSPTLAFRVQEFRYAIKNSSVLQNLFIKYIVKIFHCKARVAGN